MGFPSPAADFTEDRLSINSICNVTANSLIIETTAGYAVLDKSYRPSQGDTVLASFDGGCCFAKVMGRALITDDGEALEGEALDGVTVHGVLTHTITVFDREEGPV